MAKKKRSERVSFGKNRSKRARQGDLTHDYHKGKDFDATHSRERVRAKGEVSRKRTVKLDADGQSLAVGKTDRRGRVLSVQGLYGIIVTDDGQTHRCYVRRLLKSMESDERSVIAPGDWVWFRPAPDNEGLVVSVEPRKRSLVRRYRRRDHVIAANVEQVLIVGSLVNPVLKPNLIDRYLVSAEQGELDPIICLNKADLAEASVVQPIIGLYAQLGYQIVLTSALDGTGVQTLRDLLAGKETVVVGQSGVGKSSLLNQLNPTLHLKVKQVSDKLHKGRHTTTTSQMLKLPNGGTVVDTPGVRQFELADPVPGEIDGYFIEFRPFIPWCKFPGCTHIHEEGCAVQKAVDTGLISSGRFESYLRICEGDM